MSRVYPIFQFNVRNFVERITGCKRIVQKYERASMPTYSIQWHKGKVRWHRTARTRSDQAPDESGRIFIDQHFALIDLKSENVFLYFQFGFVESKGRTHITFPTYPIHHTDASYIVVLYVPAAYIEGMSVDDYYSYKHPANQMLQVCRDSMNFELNKDMSWQLLRCAREHIDLDRLSVSIAESNS